MKWLFVYQELVRGMFEYYVINKEHKTMIMEWKMTILDHINEVTFTNPPRMP